MVSSLQATGKTNLINLTAYERKPIMPNTGYVAYDHIGEGEGGQIGVNGYIYSPSRLFIGIMEANGQFNIYAGEGPDDSGKVKVWSTERTLPSGASNPRLILRKGPFDQQTKNLQIFYTGDASSTSSLKQL